jgi:predicted RNA polymerase sigma factor
MPAAYTYNDAIEDAKSAVVRAWENAGEPYEPHMKLVLEIVGRLENLKRPSRRKRAARMNERPSQREETPQGGQQ